ncbi:MAG: hypothetical protein U0528_14655 [Anaerolineae bacterium]
MGQSSGVYKYIATVPNVKEVILAGSADLAYWRDRLAGERLTPYAEEGKAQMLISVTALKWMGFPSRELTISVAVSRREDGGTQDGAYLVHAYNSSSMMAFMERAFFQTPYYPAQIEIESGNRAAARLVKDGKAILSLKMAANRKKLRSGERKDALWEGAIYLPSAAAKGSADRKVFYASLGGYTDVYAFA